jgi:hypothetical protein
MSDDHMKKVFGDPWYDLRRPPTPDEHVSASSFISLDPNLASEFHKRLMKWIQDFEKNLDDLHEVGVRLVSFGESLTFHLERIKYWNPSLLSFVGHTDEGEPVELIQHVTQLSVLLKKLKREDPSKPRKPIGFVHPEDQGGQ